MKIFRITNIKVEIGFVTESPWGISRARLQIEELAKDLFGDSTWIDSYQAENPAAVLVIHTTESRRHEAEGLAKFIKDILNLASVTFAVTTIDFTVI